jgi:hypothetical protein
MALHGRAVAGKAGRTAGRLDTESERDSEGMLPPETHLFSLANSSLSRGTRRMILAGRGHG